MTERRSFYRKIVYGALMAVLLFPLSYLSSPGTTKDEGGKLSQLRNDYQLGQSSLGEIDPASETMKLATLGLRGVAANLLWEKANEYKKTEDWTNLTATLEQLARLQPNFITFWKYQAWNLSYNVSVEFDDYHDRYYYVRRGIQFLEKGERYNQDNPDLLMELGWFLGQKVGRSDEAEQYRRLFKADDDYHPADRPPNQRDNWLVGKERYLQAVDAADNKGRGIGRKSPVVFYSAPAKAQMSYATAIEKEGLFERARGAWGTAEKEWIEFGNREMEHSTGVRLRFNEVDKLEEEIEAQYEAMKAIAPESAEKLYQERYDALDEATKQALSVPEDERSIEEKIRVSNSRRTMEIPAFDYAERIGEDNPELKREALLLAAEIKALEKRKSYTESYKETANYDYWKVRAEFEQTSEAIAARDYIFRGDQAFRNAEPFQAKELYEKGFEKWEEVLNEFPVLRDEEGTTGDDLLYDIIAYRKILEQLDEEIPDDFPLWDIIENFDLENKFGAELEARASRLGASSTQSSGTEEEGDETTATEGSDESDEQASEATNGEAANAE